MSAKIFLIAGEASADLHGASLLRELKLLHPSLTCYGVGGPRLAAEGMQISVPADALNVVGFSDWLDRFPAVFSSYRKLKRLIKQSPPDCAVLIDLPDLNLLMAKHLKTMNVPVVYYISPQVWAWRRYRIKKIKSRVDRMLVVFPFEKEFYRTHGVNVEFVGHPLVDLMETRTGYRPHSEVLRAPRIALLPGSRMSELRHHAPLLTEVAKRIRHRFPDANFQVPVASTLSAALLQQSFSGLGFQFIEDNARAPLKWSDIAVVASGTATLETALVGTPFCLFYKMNEMTAVIFKTVSSYRSHVGLPNLLLRKEVVREFIQSSATADNLYQECLKLIKDEDYRFRIVKSLSECRSVLGSSGASQRAAAHVSQLLKSPTRDRERKGGFSFAPSPKLT